MQLLGRKGAFKEPIRWAAKAVDSYGHVRILDLFSGLFLLAGIIVLGLFAESFPWGIVLAMCVICIRCAIIAPWGYLFVLKRLFEDRINYAGRRGPDGR